MDQDNVSQLIERLHQLHLQRVDIANEEATIIRTLRNRTGAAGNDNNGGDSPGGPPAAGVAAVIVEDAVGFQPGDNVFITNIITHVVTRIATGADRAAVVVRTTSAGRVVIRTFNGYQTNRIPRNLRRLNAAEVSVYRSQVEPRRR